MSYVAVPGVTLESEALHEVEVIRQAPYLRLVWTNPDWELYQVVGMPSLITGPARLVKMTAGLVRLDVTGTDPVEIRMRYTSHFTVVHGRGCLSQSDGGWTTLEPLQTGRFTLRTTLIPSRPEYCSN